MKTIEKTEVPADVAADADAVIASLESGKPLDPVIAKRVRERSQSIKQRIFDEYGLVDIAVPAIRELRGELPQ